MRPAAPWRRGRVHGRPGVQFRAIRRKLRGCAAAAEHDRADR